MPFDQQIPDNIVAGRNAVSELLRSGRDIEYLMVAQNAGGAAVPILKTCRQKGIVVKEMPRQKLDAKLPGINHQGIAAVVSAAEYISLSDLIERAKSDPDNPPFLVLLDNLEDPHNLGAIIRTGEAAGIHGIIIPKRRSVGLGGIAAKVASGAVEYVPVCRVPNLAATIDTLKENGIWVFGADMDGDALFQTDFSGPCAIVIGSERKGISRLVKEKCDLLVSIPMRGRINSLNAPVAAGVMLYSVVRSREQNRKG